MEVGILTYGGIVQSLVVPDKDGKLADVALDFDNLENDNELRIDYSAISDSDTIITLTNHRYFNLTGAGAGTVLDQEAMINADSRTPIDRALIPPAQLSDVKGTPFDFRKPMAIGGRIHADNEQLKNVEPKQGGYDHELRLAFPARNSKPARIFPNENL